MGCKDKLWIKLMEICWKYWGCHQMPERSFFWKKYQFPVCARCTGMMVGYILAIVLSVLGVFIKYWQCIVLLIPLIFDGCLQYKTKYLSNNFKRFVSGVLYGVGLIQIFIKVIIMIINKL